MTLKQGLDTASKIITVVETSSLIDANGNLTTPTLVGALQLLVQINAIIVQNGITEPAEVQKVVSIITAVAGMV